MKKLVVGGALFLLALGIGFSAYLWLSIRKEDRRVLRVTDAEGNTTEIHQPLLSRYISGSCSFNVCPFEEVSGLRIESGPGNDREDILWTQVRSISFIPEKDSGDGSNPRPRAIFTFLDGRTREASVYSYQVRGETEMAPYRISTADVKTIVVAEGDNLEHPQYSANEAGGVQITKTDGQTENWGGFTETQYASVIDGATQYNPAWNVQGGIRLWRGRASYEIPWSNLKEATVQADKDARGQPILKVACVFSNGHAADFTVDQPAGPWLRQQVPGTPDYNQVKLADVRHIVVTAKTPGTR